MTTLRKRVKHYGKLPSATIRDERLRHGALGILLRIVDLPDDWVVRADNMAAGRPQGRDATAADLRNLAECGYYRVERRKMRNGRFQMGNAISEEWVPQWEAEYNEFGGKPIPLIEQPDGSFVVRRKDGTITDDGFVGEYAPGVNDLPCPGELPGRTGNGKSGTGQVDQEAGAPDSDISGHGFPGSTNPDSGFSTPISTTEKYGRDVPVGAGVGDQLSLGDAKDDLGLLAVGEQPTVTRAPEAPAAKERKDQLGREAWRVAGLLPRRYRDGLPREFAFGIVHEIRKAFYEEFEAGAVLRYAALCVANDQYAADKHLPLLRVALGLMRQDARMGLVCKACGTEPDDPFGPACHRCRPDRTDMTDDDLAELEAARAFLEGDPFGDAPDDAPDDAPSPSNHDAPRTAPEGATDGARGRGATDGPTGGYGGSQGDLRDASDASDERGEGSEQDGRTDQASTQAPR